MVFNIGTSAPMFDLSVFGYPGATVTITDGKKTFTQVTGSDGNAVFHKLKKGSYVATVTAGDETATYKVTVGKNSDNMLNINAIPEFTYSGSYKIVNDSDTEITKAIKNWKIRFLTDGTLTIKKLNGAVDGIDVFLVGGGGNGNPTTHNGGGGGGGYTLTQKVVSISEEAYPITVGGAAGKTIAFGFTANPGGTKAGGRGGDGGSGGGSAGASGGSDGRNGGGAGGTGQGTTTREFGESTGKLYAGGGGGSWCYNEDTAIMSPGSGGSGGGGSGTRYDGTGGKSGAANTGGGGGGGSARAQGGSGIVIIRNKR